MAEPLIPRASEDTTPFSAATPEVDRQLAHLTALVDHMHAGVGPESARKMQTMAYENKLVEARLGVAAGLFAALRCKYAPTAAHSLRVALGCSSWAIARGMSPDDQDQLEIAALLHDVGKIGVPDAVLLKPACLTTEEAVLMDRHRKAGLDILRSFCGSSPVVEIVKYSTAWFDGSRPPDERKGVELPLGARMLALVDAFDSMTTDHVYRRAMSRERALNELFRCAGTQFDPELVKQFAEVSENEQAHAAATRRWLHQLEPELGSTRWQFNPVTFAPQSTHQNLFEHKLLDNMRDAVFFVDAALQITLWNHGAERMTGIAGSSVMAHQWLPDLVGMRDEKGRAVLDLDDPVALAVKHGEQEILRASIQGRNGQQVTVDIHAMPVSASDGAMRGAAVLLRDASPQASLEKLCHSLHERATKDPLTQVANRAEFDRTHEVFVAAHLERRLPCSLIVCDIDHFKSVNDTYGHQAGDEALKTFASLLKGFCRPGDLVARFGGEEFVILCADCNNATAAQKADQIRKALSEIALPSLGGKSITASFGVTEVQLGDTTDTMLRRADRALYEAKERGRNMVVQLGSGINGPDEEKTRPQRTWWRTLFGMGEGDLLLEKWLVTAVPIKVTIEKLRGFVADHHAEIDSIDGDTVKLRIDGEMVQNARRTDRAVAFLVEMKLTEEQVERANSQGAINRTRIYVSIRPRRDRDRRRGDSVERARMVMASLKSYLVATEADPPATPGSK